MRITVQTSSYNDRRLGKPWIAKVNFASAKGEFFFGEWIGASGQPGELSIDVEPGDIIARGQRDNKRASNSAPSFYSVNADGTLSDELTKVGAVRRWREKYQSAVESQTKVDLSGVSTDDLLAELARREAPVVAS